MCNEWSISNLIRYEDRDERWARMDKRIERTREKHELTRPIMGTIFLVVHQRVTSIENIVVTLILAETYCI